MSAPNAMKDFIEKEKTKIHQVKSNNHLLYAEEWFIQLLKNHLTSGLSMVDNIYH